MEKQADLFEDSPRTSAFWTYHEANPHVYVKLAEFALQLARSGRRRLGIAAIFERLRWYSAVETEGDEYKLNNNYRAYYARLLMASEPELRGFFQLRASKADDEIDPPTDEESEP